MIDKLKTLLKKYEGPLFSDAFVAFGSLDKVDEIKEIEIGRNHAIFDLASLSKALVTTALAIRASNDCGIDLGANIVDLLPFECGQDKQPLSISDLLSHSSGYPAWRNFWINQFEDSGKKKELDLDLSDCLEVKAKASLLTRNSPGGFVYSDIGFLILQQVIEKLANSNWPSLFEEYKKHLSVLDEDIGFNLNEKYHERCSPTGYCPIRKRELKGEVNDLNCFTLGGASGHAGLFSSGRTLIKYLTAFKSTVEFKKLAKLSSSIMLSDQDNIGLLGWRRGNGLSSKAFAGGRSIGHLGWTGTAIWLEPKSKNFGLVLTNASYKKIRPKLNLEFRTNIFQLIDDALWPDDR